MIPKNYDFGNQYRNDTIKSRTITINKDLTGASVQIQFKSQSKTGAVLKDSAIGTGLTWVDQSIGKFTIDPFIIDFAGIVYWDLQVTLNGVVDTYLEGNFKVEQDVTDN